MYTLATSWEIEHQPQLSSFKRDPWLHADLDQALQKAMQAIGQQPVPLTAVEGPHDTEAMLRQRIAALEHQVETLQSQKQG